MSPTTRYVVLDRDWTGKGWETRVSVFRDYPPDAIANAMGVYEVGGVGSADAARGTLVEWLARGRPASMSVQALTERI